MPFEDAKIGGINQNQNQNQEQQQQSGPIFPEKVPSILTTDDLVFEIGKHVIRCTNAEKGVERLITQMNQLREKMTETLQTEKNYSKERENELRGEVKKMKEELRVKENEIIRLGADMSKYRKMLQEKDEVLEKEQKLTERLKIEIEKLQTNISKKKGKGKKKP